MKQSECLGVNEQGHLTLGGCDTVELAEQYGTPLYLLDEVGVRAACRSYRESIERFYQGRGMVCYASKAFCCKEIYRLMDSEQMGVDVVSEGELYTALAAGFPAERICFHGNNKTDRELCYALDSDIGLIIVDNRYELERLNRFAEQRGKCPSIAFRIKPGVDAHTHEFVRTGQIDSKFGVALETGEAMEIVREALALDHVHLKGVHCHIGSQIFELEPFELAAQRMVEFMAQVRQETGFVIEELDLGGGFGICYTESDAALRYDSYMEKVSQVVRDTCRSLDFPQPFVMLEPGRSIVGSSGITLYTAGAIKEIPGVRTYVAVDGGMTDNPRYALYQSKYEAVVANRADQPKTMTVTLAGKCCESGDLLGENMPIQPVGSGDIVAVLSTGAYNYSMASNYNRLCRPAVVMVNHGEPRVIVQRESLEDLIRNDL